MSVLGNSVLQQSFTPAVDYFSGNGSTTAFTLSRPVAAAGQIVAVIENVPQSPYDAFTVNGNTITFTSAPPSGSSNIYVYYTTLTTQSVQPTDGSVGLRQLSSDIQGALYGFKNRIINGAMVIDQRNNGAAVSIGTGAPFIVDRWNAYTDLLNMTGQRSTVAPSGFVNSLGITVGTGASPTVGQISRLEQRIEGFNFADLGWGTAGAQSVTVSFWVRCSVTGTHSGAFGNAAGARGYPFTFTISAANTWEYKTVTIAGDTTGTWVTDNGTGCRVVFNLGTGSTFLGAAGSWAASNVFGAIGSVQLSATTGATFYITGVQLEKGTTPTAFDFREYGEELRRCQRYFQKYIEPPLKGGCQINTQLYRMGMVLPVVMRAVPTASLTGGLSWFDFSSSGATSTTITAAYNTETKVEMDLPVAVGTPLAGRAITIFAGTSNALLLNAEL